MLKKSLVFLLVVVLGGVLFLIPQRSIAGEGPSSVCRVPSTAIGLVSDYRSILYTADRASGEVLSFSLAGEPVLLGRVTGHPAVIAVDCSRTVFIGTEEGVVYSLSGEGRVREVYRISEQPVGMTVDRDGALLIAKTGGAVVRVSRSHMAASAEEAAKN